MPHQEPPPDDRKDDGIQLPDSLQHLRPEGPKSGLSGVGKYAGLGIQFAVAIVLFLKLGEWADRRLGTEPILLYVGVFIGAGAAFYSMYRGLMADQRKEEAEKARRRGTKDLK